MKLGWIIALAASVAAPFVLWNIPVGKTEKGNGVVVGDYIAAALPTFSKGSGQNSPRDEQDKITLRLFDLMEPGTTHAGTVRDLLDQGEVVSSSDYGGTRAENYLIRNTDGSSAMLLFQDGVLASKSQNGLH